MILHNGILGKGTKKIGNVVGANWKDKNYVRSYVIPANPNTVAQQTQRTKFKDAVYFILGAIGQILNTFVDPFMKGMSAYNYFIKKNISIFDGTPDYDSIQVTWGQLFPLQVTTALLNPAGDNVRVSWSTATGNNGKASDVASAAVYSSLTGKWYWHTPISIRSDAGTDVPVDAGSVSTDLHAWAWCHQMSGSTMKLVSNSVGEDVVDAP